MPPCPPSNSHVQEERRRQLTNAVVQIRTQKAEVLRQAQANFERQNTRGLPAAAAAATERLTEQDERAEKVRPCSA